MGYDLTWYTICMSWRVVHIMNFAVGGAEVGAVAGQVLGILNSHADTHADKNNLTLCRLDASTVRIPLRIDKPLISA